MSHVFISYSHEDADFVSRLDEIFQDEHINTWVDRKRLKAGDNWRDVIDREIKNAFALIVVLSPHAVVSPYVTYEWSFALGIGLEIIPVICRQIKFDDNAQKNREIENQLTSELEDINHRYHIKIPKPLIHPRLDVFQYIDLSHEDDNSPKWQDLIAQIKEKQQNFRPHSVNVPREAPQIVHDMVEKLNSGDKEVRKNAIIDLWDMDSPYVEDILIKALRHQLPDVRQWSARGLGVRKCERSLPELSKLLQNDKFASVREWALDAVIKIGGDEIIPTLIVASKDPENNIRSKAIQELGKTENIIALESLIEALADKDEYLRIITPPAIAKIGEKAVPSLIEALEHSNPLIKSGVKKALGMIGTPESQEALKKYR